MKQTQGRRLIAALKRRAMTYGEMHDMHVSTSPQKRVVEALAEGEQIVKGKRWIEGKRYLTTWRVVSATKWSA